MGEIKEMIIECGKVIIDTELDHKAHKEAIEKTTSFFCREDEPVYWFTQPQAEGGRSRFYHLHYNNSGDVLLKITSWDKAPEKYKKIKQLKGVKDMCYFMRKETRPEEEYEWVTKKDYTGDISENSMTHWSRNWKDKKRWGF